MSTAIVSFEAGQGQTARWFQHPAKQNYLALQVFCGVAGWQWAFVESNTRSKSTSIAERHYTDGPYKPFSVGKVYNYDTALGRPIVREVQRDNGVSMICQQCQQLARQYPQPGDPRGQLWTTCEGPVIGGCVHCRRPPANGNVGQGVQVVRHVCRPAM